MRLLHIGRHWWYACSLEEGNKQSYTLLDRPPTAKRITSAVDKAAGATATFSVSSGSPAKKGGLIKAVGPRKAASHTPELAARKGGTAQQMSEDKLKAKSAGTIDHMF